MSFFFVPTQLRDVSIIKAASGNNFENAPVFCSGIEICERTLELGGKNVSFYELTTETIRKLGDVSETVAALARSFDALHSELRTRHLGLETASVGWDYSNFEFIARNILELHTTFSPFLEKLPLEKKPVIFHCKNSQDLFFDSALTRGLIGGLISKRFKDITRIEIPPPEIFDEKANAFELDIPTGDFKVLTHLPTVFYSISFHQKRLAADEAFQKGAVDLQSAYFDIPMTPDRIRLRHREWKSMSESFKTYLEALEECLKDFYSSLDVLEVAVQAGMLERHKGWAISQYNAFLALQESESLKGVERLEISCHDTGLAGPLITWANHRGIPVEMWPHSEVINTVTPVLKKGRKHFHISGRTQILELGVGKSAWVEPKVRLRDAPGAKKTLLILMNQLDSTGDVPRCRVLELRKGLDLFARRLQAEGWQVRLRQKPSHPYHHLLRLEHVETAAESLDAWLDWPEVCLSVVVPTTAIIRFWQNGVRCFHLQEHAPHPGEKFIIPRENVRVHHSDEFPALLEKVLAEILRPDPSGI